MNCTIHPCIWYNNNAQEAANFYCNIFDNSSITINTPMVVNFNLCGSKFMGLNGGDMFKPNTTISFFAFCKTIADVEKLWNALHVDGRIYMPLNTYPWSNKYGWCADKYGVNWQIMLDETMIENQKVVPSLFFVNEQKGKAEEAMNFYMSLFDNSAAIVVNKYGENDVQPQGFIKYARFTLNSKEFSVMDNAHPHEDNFTEGVSLVIECNNQTEIDFYWNSFVNNGGQESMCGWCKDKYGVSWQIIPKNIGEILTNSTTSSTAMPKLMQMRKIDIAELTKA